MGVVLLALAVTACTASGESDSEAAPHAHGPGGEYVAALAGDGTRTQEGGFAMTEVSLPAKAGKPGEVRFTIRDADGEPVRDYVTEQTKDLHLYVVRTDLTVFRHLHPALGDDGAWSAPVTLPEAGEYRVVAEFVVAPPEGGSGQPAFVMLGAEAEVPGAWTPAPITIDAEGDDGSVRVAVSNQPTVGPGGELRLTVTDLDGRPVELGSYLGTTAHVTAFRTDTYAVAHLHPLGAPSQTADGTILRLHTSFTEAGDYVAFVQVRVDGFVHTVSVWLRVTG